MIDVKRVQQRTAALTGPDGTLIPLLPVIDASYQQTPAAVSSAVNDAKNGRATISLVGTTLPIIAGILGALLIAGATAPPNPPPGHPRAARRPHLRAVHRALRRLGAAPGNRQLTLRAAVVRSPERSSGGRPCECPIPLRSPQPKRSTHGARPPVGRRGPNLGGRDGGVRLAVRALRAGTTPCTGRRSATSPRTLGSRWRSSTSGTAADPGPNRGRPSTSNRCSSRCGSAGERSAHR